MNKTESQCCGTKSTDNINLSPHDFGIVRPYLDRISDKDLNIMLEDCEFQRQTEMYGDERIDKPAWLKWHDELKAERERRKNAKQ